MMKMMLTLAALAAVAPALPAHAQPAPAPRSVAVVHSDLDLSTARGADKLERRIWRAVVTVCGSAPDYDLEGKNDVRHCRRDTMRQASADADRVIASAATRGEPIRVTLAK
ncbi:UrcA family protein [Sphingopyxis terrae subsp. ummariensis]